MASTSTSTFPSNHPHPQFPSSSFSSSSITKNQNQNQNQMIIDVPTVIIFDTSLPRRRFLEIIGSIPPSSSLSVNENAPSEADVLKGELGDILRRVIRGKEVVGGGGQGKGKGKEKEKGPSQGIRVPRFSIIITSTPHSSSSASTSSSSSSSSFSSDPSFIPQSTPILHSQYFSPIESFWQGLNGLSGLFPSEVVIPGMIGIGMNGGGGGNGANVGVGGKDKGKVVEGAGEKGKEGGPNPTPQSSSSPSPSTLNGGPSSFPTQQGPEDDYGLLEGFISALEQFDLQSRHPFSSSSSSSSVDISSLSPFASGSKTNTRERERYLIVFSARDPALFLEEKENWVEMSAESGIPSQSLGGNDSAARTGSGSSTTVRQTQPINVIQNINKNKNDKGAGGSYAQTGLISPSPSPEDRASHLLHLSSSSPTKRHAALKTVFQAKADKALRRRVRSNWTEGFDCVGWSELASELTKRGVVIGTVLSGQGGVGMIKGDERLDSGMKWVGALSGLMSRVRKGREGGEGGQRVMGEPWWQVSEGSQALLIGWEDEGSGSVGTVVAEPTGPPTSSVQDEKNANGKRPLSVASPLEQDLETEAKRFKAEKELSIRVSQAQAQYQAQQQQLATNNSGLSLTATPAMQASMSNMTPAQLAVVNEAIAKQATMGKLAEHIRMNPQQAGPLAGNIPTGTNNPMGLGASSDLAQQLHDAQNALLQQRHAVMAQNAWNATERPRSMGLNANRPAQYQNQMMSGSSNDQTQTQTLPTQTSQSTQPPAARSSPPTIWKGRLLTSAPKLDANGKVQVDDGVPLVYAVPVQQSGNLADYGPQNWPANFLIVKGAFKRDMMALQDFVSQQKCLFVEFRPETGQMPGSDQAQANMTAFGTLAAKLAQADIMLLYQVGPQSGGGMILVPHRTNEGSPYKLLGACFFRSPIPPNVLRKPGGIPPSQIQPPMPAQPQVTPNPPPPASHTSAAAATLHQHRERIQESLNKAGLGHFDLDTLTPQQIQTLLSSLRNRSNQQQASA